MRKKEFWVKSTFRFKITGAQMHTIYVNVAKLQQSLNKRTGPLLSNIQTAPNELKQGKKFDVVRFINMIILRINYKVWGELQ